MPKKNCPHTAFKKNTKVFIKMMSGETFTDHFIDKKSGVVIFRERGRIDIKDVQAISIFKHQPHIGT